MIADQKETDEVHFLLESARVQMRPNQNQRSDQNMYEGRVVDRETTKASLCACDALSGCASWAGRVWYISNKSSEVATHKRATPKTSRFSRAVFCCSLFVSVNLMSISIIDARRPALVTAAGFNRKINRHQSLDLRAVKKLVPKNCAVGYFDPLIHRCAMTSA